MKTWTITKEVNVSIDKVWDVIDGSEENLKNLDPKIISQETLIVTEERVGSKYLQKYKEGKKVMEYEVVVTDYNETDYEKMFAIGFNLGGWFDIAVRYELEKIDENKTIIKYTTTNKPLKFLAKVMMKFMPGGDNMLEKHIKKIEELAKS